MRNYEDYEADYEPEEGEDVMETNTATGEGIKIDINIGAMERIEAAAMHGLRQAIMTKVDQIIEDEIRDVVAEKLGEVVGRLADATILEYLTKPRPRTNAYGEKVSGTPMTIADQIPEKVEAWLSGSVQSDGRPADHYDRGKQTRLEWMLNNMVRGELDAATKAAAASVTEQAKKVVAAHVGRFVAEQMIPQIDVSKQR